MYFREDGYLSSGNTRKGKIVFTSPKAFQRNKINMVLVNIRKRCKQSNLPFDIDQEYLLSIFPKDFLCPVTGILMQWGYENGRDSSPSIDRIIPELGYVRNNLVWVCCKVNRIKSDSSIEFLNTLVNFYNKASDNLSNNHPTITSQP